MCYCEFALSRALLIRQEIWFQKHGLVPDTNSPRKSMSYVLGVKRSNRTETIVSVF